MNNATDTARSARERFKTDFTQIMLTVLGIIQGLALNQLADKMMRGSYADALPGNRWLWLHFALCMLILIRVFQTYLLAALDYTGWRTSFYDALFIFAAGLLQYWVFDALEQSAAAPQELHLRAGTLVSLASAIHFFALLRIWFGSELTDKSADHRRREIWLQIWNTLLAGLCAASCWVGTLQPVTMQQSVLLSGAAAAIIALNIWVSLRMTIGADGT